MMFGKLTLGPAADGSGDLATLETVCEACDGTGFIAGRREGNSFTSGGECHVCHGMQTIVTDDGKKLLAFLGRHWR